MDESFPPAKPVEAPNPQGELLITATSKAGGSKQMRTFAEILADEKANRNILEIKLTKINKPGLSSENKVENLSLE